MYSGAFSLLAAEDDDDAAASPPAPPPPLPALADGDHPFTCDPGDHAETPLSAFRDVAPLLGRLASRLGAAPASLRLYDPFFCSGTCKTHLASLGFNSVYNENEDFYRAVASGGVPAHDVLVSNPPYTLDHLERTFRFCWAQGRPYFLLVPQFVARKPWMLQHLDAEARRGRGGGARQVYLGPKTQPYVFSAPATRKDAVWVIGGLGAHQAPLLEWWRRVCAEEADCVLAASPAELHQFARSAALTPAERRWKRKARDGEAAPAEADEERVAPPAARTAGRGRASAR